MRLFRLLDFGYSKTIYNENFSEYALKEEDLKKLQQVLLGILIDFDKVCRENGIKYILGDGSLLGAVRHNGFIPWDDDVDVIMTRDNYERFVDLGMQSIGSKYLLLEPLKNSYDAIFPNLLLKGTKRVGITGVGNPNSPSGIGIDIFIAEYVPKNIVVRHLKGLLFTFFVGAFVCYRDYLYPSSVIVKKEKYIEPLKHYYEFRRLLGYIFSHFGKMSSYQTLAIKMVSSNKPSDNLCPVADWGGYRKAVFSREMYVETVDVLFEGVLLPIPVNYDIFLRDCYGDDYMSLPPENEREKHFVVELVL